MTQEATPAPIGLGGRPVVDGAPLPFACEDEEHGGDHARLLKRRAIQCALSRVCGVCGQPLTRPIAFLGSPEEASAGSFAFPPCHRVCADAAVLELGALGAGHLGRREAPSSWHVVATAGFELVRPQRRGAPVAFRPNSVLPQ